MHSQVFLGVNLQTITLPRKGIFLRFCEGREAFYFPLGRGRHFTQCFAVFRGQGGRGVIDRRSITSWAASGRQLGHSMLVQVAEELIGGGCWDEENDHEELELGCWGYRLVMVLIGG